MTYETCHQVPGGFVKMATSFTGRGKAGCSAVDGVCCVVLGRHTSATFHKADLTAANRGLQAAVKAQSLTEFFPFPHPVFRAATFAC